MSHKTQNQEAQDQHEASQPKEQLTPYEVMLSSAPPDYLTNIEEDSRELPPEYPVYYFFYGTLTTPSTLQRIIDSPDEPELRKSELVGYALAKWGDYPALIDGEQGQVVSGSAYLVKSQDEADKLAYYETNAYRVAYCYIDFTDGNEPTGAMGRVFMYAGDAKALLEQRFDRKLWELQMGMKLR
ncbi:gamma-glutamylcyclotransferase family protein [Aspergillus melleus]|uniref:gamma-glutamylcyclotransferase family protein n=1 Tax=Aspergillus melleus TaxID=138277 RepID=UPI001E8E2148|nr:uncharacterized protein LDX57_012477 [Aspergillus melleus]KAH8434846.1 hypothetical protein LDX57_012477 [Aspergillus melleus]